MRVREIEAGRARKNNGIIEILAGSHAQGVAYHAQRLGIAAIVVMPKSTPFTKIIRTQGSDARVVFEGDSVSDAKPHADEIANKEGFVFVHPYEDTHIIGG